MDPLKARPSLLSQLTRFGLNPNHWSMESVSHGSLILLKNLEDQQFQMLGRVNSKASKPKLTELSLLSL